LKQATLFIALLGAIFLVGCGGNGDTTSQSTFNNGTGDQPFKPTTHLSHRSVVTNYYGGDMQVVDATQNRLTSYTFATGTQPTYLQSSPDGTLTMSNNTGSNTISSLNNNLEAVKATIALGGWTESFVTSVDNKFGFAAVYNYSNGITNDSGAIVRFNPTDGSLNFPIPLANVHYLAMDSIEKHLLVFADKTTADTQSSCVVNSACWVDLTTEDSTTQLPVVSVLALPAGTLSRPVAAFFAAASTSSSTSGTTITSSTTSKAYVLNCGTECGGTSNPNVVELDITETQSTTGSVVTSSTTATVGNTWTVPGARRGLIDLTANKLYVAGSTTTLTDSGGNNVQDGYFTTIDLTAGTQTSIQTGNGAKRWIRNIKGVFWVASTNCGVQSCITMVNPSSNTATVLSNARGDATGVSLQSNSSKVYTIEGGELYIYTQNGSVFTSEYTTDVKGQAYDVMYID